MSAALSGRSTDVLAGEAPVGRRLVEGGPAGCQDGDEVEQAERGDARLAGLLPQGDVVAPEGKLVLLGDGDGVGRGAGRRCRLACLRGGGDGFEGFGARAQQVLLGGGEGAAVDGPVGGQRGGVGGGGQVPHVVPGQEGVVDGGAGDGQAGQGRADAEPVVVREQAEQVQRGQVRGAGSRLDCLPGGSLPGGPQPGRRGRPRAGCRRGGGAGRSRKAGPRGRDVGHAGGAGLHAGEELLVRGLVRNPLLQRSPQRRVVCRGRSAARCRAGSWCRPQAGRSRR